MSLHTGDDSDSGQEALALFEEELESDVEEETHWEVISWGFEQLPEVWVHCQLAQCWASARMMAEWLLNQGKAYVEGKTCVELGAALGLPTLAASLAGAKRAVATDLDKRGGKAMTKTIRKNQELRSDGGLFASAEWRQCDWLKALEGLQELAGSCDVVLCADAIYEARCAGPLAQAIATAIKPGGTLLFASRHGRKGLAEFLEIALLAKADGGAGLVLLQEEVLQSSLMGLGMEEGERHSLWFFQAAEL